MGVRKDNMPLMTLEPYIVLYFSYVAHAAGERAYACTCTMFVCVCMINII